MPMSMLFCMGLSVCVGPGARTLVPSVTSVHHVPLCDVASVSSRAPAGLMPLFVQMKQQELCLFVSLYDLLPCFFCFQYERGLVEYYYATYPLTAVRAPLGVGGSGAVAQCVCASFVDLLTFDAFLLLATISFFTIAFMGGRILSFGQPSFGSKTKLPTLFLFLLLFALGGANCTCPHCKDSIQGCTGGNNCPLYKEQAANVAMFDNRVLGSAPRVTYSFPPELAAAFPRSVCEAVVGLACAPAPGAEIDLENDAQYATCRAVVQAASFRHCSVPEASSVLSARLEAATDELDIMKIRGSMDALKLVQESVVEMTQGVFGFLWAKTTNVIMKRGSVVHRLSAGVKAKVSELTVSLMRPSTESEFDDMLHYYQMVLVGLGLASFWVVSRFLEDVVWATRRMKNSWKVAHELLLLYVHEVDRDPSSAVTMGNVFRRGGQDTLMAEARRNAVMFFRTGGGDPQPLVGDDLCPPCEANGKFNTASAKLCVDYNAGRPCKRLDKQGACQFNHACNQFVSDKGAGGMCRGVHARTECSYDAAKRLTKPSTQ